MIEEDGWQLPQALYIIRNEGKKERNKRGVGKERGSGGKRKGGGNTCHPCPTHLVARSLRASTAGPILVLPPASPQVSGTLLVINKHQQKKNQVSTVSQTHRLPASSDRHVGLEPYHVFCSSWCFVFFFFKKNILKLRNFTWKKSLFPVSY